jgi:hypothetical protein
MQTRAPKQDILVRLCSNVKRVASLIDSSLYSSLRDRVLLSALQLQEFLPEISLSVPLIELRN